MIKCVSMLLSKEIAKAIVMQFAREIFEKGELAATRDSLNNYWIPALKISKRSAGRWLTVTIATKHHHRVRVVVCRIMLGCR